MNNNKMAPRVKLFNIEGSCKLIPYPSNFDELIKKAKEFVPFQENTKRYQLIELKANKEITTQEDFELMTKEYQNEKNIRIKVNLVNNDTKYLIPEKNGYIIEKNDFNKIINESNINIQGINYQEESNGKISDNVKLVIKKKLKELEDKLVDELYNNSMIEIKNSKINNQINGLKKSNSKNLHVHKGIICNKCGLEIIGERFKCSQCQNFNLCGNCEKNYNHDIRHIMVSIIFPIDNEKEFSMKLDKNIRYKNENMNYIMEPKIFSFNKINDIQIQEVTFKNIGTQSWKDIVFRCIEDKSELIGQECKIDENINPGQEIKTKISFFNIDNQANKGKDVYYSFFQMFNKKNQSFGNVTKIKIILKNN